eukprot:TRINITY_DN11174_c0_g1_i2.p1 TRINITY_DN11174_c0_g1~~TRINITY_DN11174_c0_g1_i2.p1  ORF type:complete len:518 (+),score=118.42 TRINITY_DN11174_c0_g1_i2:97-1650(+)
MLSPQDRDPTLLPHHHQSFGSYDFGANSFQSLRQQQNYDRDDLRRQSYSPDCRQPSSPDRRKPAAASPDHRQPALSPAESRILNSLSPCRRPPLTPEESKYLMSSAAADHLSRAASECGRNAYSHSRGAGQTIGSLVAAEECTPGLLDGLGEHAATLSWLVDVALDRIQQRPQSAVGEPALRRLLQELSRMHQAFKASEAMGPQQHAQLMAARGQADMEAMQRKSAEAAMGAELSKVCKALYAERANRSALQEEVLRLRGQLELAAGASAQTAGDLMSEKRALEKERQTLSEASSELQKARERAMVEQAEIGRLQAAVAELTRESEDRGQEVRELRSALIGTAGRAREAAVFSAQNEGEKALAWRQRSEEAEVALQDIRRQLAQAQVRVENSRAELQLIEGLLACVEGTPPRLRASSGKPLQKGSWLNPSEACGADERRALDMAQKAEAYVREHLVHGKRLGKASRHAMRLALGVAVSEALLLEFRVGELGAPRLPIHAVLWEENNSQVDWAPPLFT